MLENFRLIEACEKPGASVSGLALKAGVNANQLRKWIMLERRRAMHIDSGKSTRTGSAEFVPIVEVAKPDAVTVSANPPSSAAVPASQFMPCAPWQIPVAALSSEAVQIGVRGVIERRPRNFEALQDEKTLRLPGF